MKATNVIYGEWWAGRLTRRSIILNFKDVNISFNHPAYCLMSKDEGRVVAQAGSFDDEA